MRHTNAIAMDSLGIPQSIRKQRLGHSGSTVTENYTHTFTQDERVAAENLGELFGDFFPDLSRKQEWPAGYNQQAFANQ